MDITNNSRNGVEESGDTQITIQNSPRPVSAPVIQPPVRQTVTTTTHSAPQPSGDYAGPSYAGPHFAAPHPSKPAIETRSHRQVNWGNIVKGALVVTAVVLVGVIAFNLLVPFATGFASTSGLGSLVASVSPAVSSVAGAVGSGLSYAFNFAVGFLSVPFEAIFGGAAASTAAASAATTTVATTAASQATGTAIAAVGAGGAVALAAPFAVKAMQSMPVVDTMHHHTTITTPPAVLDDGGASHTVTHVQTQPTAATTHLDVAELPDVPEELAASQHSTAKMASKVAHHAVHEGEHRHTVTHALARGADTSRSWAERAGKSERPAIAARKSEFSSQLEADRMALDSALGQQASR